MATMSKAPAAELSAEDMKKLLNAQRTAFLKEGPPSTRPLLWRDSPVRSG
jgi:surface antigen